jgi:GTPase SAR1 family protein
MHPARKLWCWQDLPCGEVPQVEQCLNSQSYVPLTPTFTNRQRWKGDQNPTIGTAFGLKTMNVGFFALCELERSDASPVLLPRHWSLSAYLSSCSRVQVKSGGKEIVHNIGVWDTAGSERYYSMTQHYYKGSHAAVICYDITKRKSWEKVKYWVEELQKVERKSCAPPETCPIPSVFSWSRVLQQVTEHERVAFVAANVIILLVGTKQDLVDDGKAEREVNRQSVVEYANLIEAKVVVRTKHSAAQSDPKLNPCPPHTHAVPSFRRTKHRR